VPASFFSALAVAIAREQTRWIASREALRTVVVEREFSPLRRSAFGFTLFVGALGESRGHVSTLENHSWASCKGENDNDVDEIKT
jgi:hypothetical protein